jgi:hypothetical protein
MQTLKRIPYSVSLILLAYMPFHILLSQWLSTYTGGLEVWKIAKDVLLLFVVLFTICLVWAQGKGNKAFNLLVGLGTVYGLTHLLLWWAHPNIYSRSAEIGIIYNMRLPMYAVLGYGAWLLYPKFVFSSVIKVILIISTIVATFGVLQYFLPGDLLTHFGYGLDRGVRPAFYIDDNTSLPIRVMSTLREPNALGAYLILPMLALASLILKAKDKQKQVIFGAALAVHLIALVLTQSRSALLGLFAAGSLIVWWQYQTWFARAVKRFWPLLLVLCIAGASGLFAIRNTAFFDSYVVHSNKDEQVQDLDSNDYHSLFIKRGLEGIQDQPLGHGPGTAGLASIQNPKGSFLTENYYVQIGYELGLIGLAMFIGLNAWLYVRVLKSGNVWAPVVLASFWAYVITNMLLHTWSNEAVAAQWWILAGMLAATSTTKKAPSRP